MSRSDYSYSLSLTDNKDKVIIAIVDLDLDGMSVTNNIENVVDEVCKKEKINSQDCLVVYRDSMGYWDGWDTNSKIFIVIRQRNVKDALRIIKKYNEHEEIHKRKDALHTN